MGRPYTRTRADIDGRGAIDWGVYGVPETFVIDTQGHIAFKQVGPITPQILETTILPLVARLRTSSSAASGASRSRRRGCDAQGISAEACDDCDRHRCNPHIP